MKIKNQCGGNKNPNGGCSAPKEILPIGIATAKVITMGAGGWKKDVEAERKPKAA